MMTLACRIAWVGVGIAAARVGWLVVMDLLQ